MKQKISLEVKQKHISHNIKLGLGGIREIEFFGQIFQLIRGGVAPALQEQSLRKDPETRLLSSHGRNRLNKLKAAGRIRHVGPTKSGRWEMIDDR